MTSRSRKAWQLIRGVFVGSLLAFIAAVNFGLEINGFVPRISAKAGACDPTPQCGGDCQASGNAFCCWGNSPDGDACYLLRWLA